MQRMNVLLLCAGLLFSLIAGCDRFKDDTPNANQAPTARFVNFPEDSTQFSYAPQVHWQGYDPDGFVTGFEYFDDASAEGLAAYRAGDAAFQEYVDGLPDAAWLFTEAASGQIYLLTDIGEISEHVFMVRAIDNLDARSQVAVRTFFRTNLPPDTPKLRWSNSTSTDYEEHIAIPDTQMVGDTLTITYTGVRLLWQGSDPDSRSTNIIPLEFSYALVNALGDSIALPVRNDSNHVVGYRAGWSNWGGETQIALYGLETGDYTFYLRVRDDGFTQSNTPGCAQFTVVNATLAGQLLIVSDAVTRLNHALAIPGFDLNHQHGLVAYRLYLPIYPRGSIRPNEVQAMFRLTVKTAADFFPTIRRIIAGEIKPEDIVDEAKKAWEAAAAAAQPAKPPETPPSTNQPPPGANMY